MVVPWMHTVTIPNANQNYSIHALALTSSDPVVNTSAAIIAIQADSSVAATYRIGNSTLNDTDFGVALSNFQMFGMAAEANALILTDMYVRCSIAGQRLHLSLVTR